MHKSKEATARLSMFKEIRVPAVYTMETSFCGANQGAYEGMHFNSDMLMEAGRKILFALIVYCEIDVKQTLKEIRSKPIERDEDNEQDREQEEEDYFECEF
jgi:hypothetical protein